MRHGSHEVTLTPKHPRLALAVVLAGAIVAPLDTAVNVAFPAITDAFGLDLPEIRWIVIVYVLTYGGLMLVGGRLGDLHGYRRVFGMEHQSYQILEYPFKVQNDIANTKIAFGAMAKYRLYRRQGAETRWVDGGAEMARRNMNLLIVRGRFGGQVVDVSAFSRATNFQT